VPAEHSNWYPCLNGLLTYLLKSILKLKKYFTKYFRPKNSVKFYSTNCVWCAVIGRLDVNVALGRPTYMSSVYYDGSFGGYFYSSRAVDGNKDPTCYSVGNSCVHSLTESNPWWAVDLGTALAVVGVRFTNRADSFGYNISLFCSLLFTITPVCSVREQAISSTFNY